MKLRARLLTAKNFILGLCALTLARQDDKETEANHDADEEGDGQAGPGAATHAHKNRCHNTKAVSPCPMVQEFRAHHGYHLAPREGAYPSPNRSLGPPLHRLNDGTTRLDAARSPPTTLGAPQNQQGWSPFVISFLVLCLLGPNGRP